MNLEQFNSLKEKCTPAEILAVSKLQPVEKIRALYSFGQRHFGENYVQEALSKQVDLADLTDIQWHLIGHLQKNKAKLVVGRFHLIHSVDSLELARILSHHCVIQQVEQKILLQVNLAGEDSKEGFDLKNLHQAWPELQQLPQISICGLMTMPPLTETPEEVRPYFRELRLLKDDLQRTQTQNLHPLSELSMGTSHDFEIAIKEGSSLVRLGTILFGERPRKG